MQGKGNREHFMSKYIQKVLYTRSNLGTHFINQRKME